MSPRQPAWVGVSLAMLLGQMLLLSGAPAVAQRPSEDALVRQAEQLAARGDHSAALALLRIAVTRSPSPRALGLLGLAATRQGEPVEAEGPLQRALAISTDAWVVAHRRELTTALTEVARQLGTVIVEGVADGTAVRIAGRDVGAAPVAPTRVRAGEVVVEAGAARVTVVVAAGATVTATPSAPSEALPTTESESGFPATTLLEGYEAAPMPPAATSDATPPAVFGDTPSDAQIPTSFTAALPPPPAPPPRRPSPWIHGFRLKVGLGVGGGGLVEPIVLAEDEIYYSAAVGRRSVYFAVVPSVGFTYGLSPAVELAVRLDVVVTPLALHVSCNGSWGGNARLIAPVIAPGFRLRPIATGKLYLAAAARLGVAVSLVEVFPGGLCAPDLGPETITVLGGELGVGAMFGSHAQWDLGARMAYDGLGLSILVALAWSVL